jgi:hypothetical protein
MSLSYAKMRESFHAALVDFINETWEDRPKFEAACNRAWLHMKGPMRMRKRFAFLHAEHLVSGQLSGKNPRLNPKSENPEKPASSSDAGNSEFNTLTLEVNPKQEIELVPVSTVPPEFIKGTTTREVQTPHSFWDDAPAWANYWACDADGQCYWYRDKPDLLDGGGRWLHGGYYIKDMNVPAPGWDCRHSLIRRPGIQEQQP